MEEAFTFVAAAPFVVAALALVRQIVPELRGRLVPLVALGLTVAWGAVLAVSGRFTGDAAEFVVAVVVVTSAAIGGASLINTYSREGSTAHRLT